MGTLLGLNTRTFRTEEAPGDVDVLVMWLGSDWLEVTTTHDVVTLQLHAAGCHAELSHVVGCRTPYTLEETTYKKWH